MLLDGADNHQQLPPSPWALGNPHPIEHMVPWTHPSLHPKRHVDRFSRFCTAHRRLVECPITSQRGATFSPKIAPSPWGLESPIWQIVPRTHPSHHPKWHINRYSRFCMGPKCSAVQCIVSGEENPQNCPFPLGFRNKLDPLKDTFAQPNSRENFILIDQNITAQFTCEIKKTEHIQSNYKR